MTPEDKRAAWEKWLASDDIHVGLSRVAEFDGNELTKWLRVAFVAGFEAAEGKKRWPDSAVETGRQWMHEIGVIWP